MLARSADPWVGILFQERFARDLSTAEAERLDDGDLRAVEVEFHEPWWGK